MFSSKKQIEQKYLQKSWAALEKIKKDAPDVFAKFVDNKNNLPVSANKKILIICYDALGDFILCTPILFFLSDYFKDCKIDLVVSKRNYELAKAYNKFNKLWVLNLNDMFDDANATCDQIKANSYDYTLNLFNTPSLFALNKIANMLSESTTYLSLPYKHKDKEQFRFLKKYASNISNDESLHFVDEMSHMANLVGSNSKNVSRKYHLPSVGDSNRTENINFKVLFNPFGSQKGNTLNKVKTQLIIYKILKISNIDLYIFSQAAEKLFFIPHNSRLKIVHSQSILEAIKILQNMNVVITTDTSIMHIATALEKKLIVLQNNEPWRKAFDPVYGSFKVINSRSKNISRISLSQIVESLRGFLDL